jgi:hypothetical protein
MNHGHTKYDLCQRGQDRTRECIIISHAVSTKNGYH